MTAATDAPVRPIVTASAWDAPVSLLRLLRIELRRSSVVLILPLVAALFWFDSYRPSTAQQPFWVLRTFWNMGQGHTIIDVGPFVAGMAAWIASRDGRRGTTDLVSTTVRARWTTRLASWAATAIWAVVAYLVFVGVMFGVYADQGVTGQVPWWWVAVGATAVAAFSAAGFAVGAFFPSRYAAPLAAFGGFLAMVLSAQTGFRDRTGWALVLPTNSNGNYDQQDSGIFYHYLPDLPIARIIFLAGILVACLGLLGLPSGAGRRWSRGAGRRWSRGAGRRSSRGAAGRWSRRAAAVVTLVGVAVTGTAAGLAATARPSPQGMAIAALHDTANDRPIDYTPVCGTAAQTPVCLNPAYRRYLTDVTAALAPVLTQVAGLPGAPERVTQVAATYDTRGAMTISGSPPALSIPLGAESSLPGTSGFHEGVTTTTQFGNILRAQFTQAFVGAGINDDNAARQAVAGALLLRAGVPLADLPKLKAIAQEGPGPEIGPATGPVYAAAQRLAALPDTTLHAWLAAHLVALRAGGLTLDQLP